MDIRRHLLCVGLVGWSGACAAGDVGWWPRSGRTGFDALGRAGWAGSADVPQVTRIDSTDVQGSQRYRDLSRALDRRLSCTADRCAVPQLRLRDVGSRAGRRSSAATLAASTLRGSVPRRQPRHAGRRGATSGGRAGPSASTGSAQNEPVQTAREPASPTRNTWTTAAPASATATTATTTPTHGGGASLRRRASSVGTPQASRAHEQADGEPEHGVAQVGVLLDQRVSGTRACSHSPALVATGTEISASSATSGVMMPSRRRAAGHTADSTVSSAASGMSTTTRVHQQDVQRASR